MVHNPFAFEPAILPYVRRDLKPKAVFISPCFPCLFAFHLFYHNEDPLSPHWRTSEQPRISFPILSHERHLLSFPFTMICHVVSHLPYAPGISPAPKSHWQNWHSTPNRRCLSLTHPLSDNLILGVILTIFNFFYRSFTVTSKRAFLSNNQKVSSAIEQVCFGVSKICCRRPNKFSRWRFRRDRTEWSAVGSQRTLHSQLSMQSSPSTAFFPSEFLLILTMVSSRSKHHKNWWRGAVEETLLLKALWLTVTRLSRIQEQWQKIICTAPSKN